MTQYATTYQKEAPLSTDFAQSFLARRFGDAGAAMILRAFPAYTKGRKAGKPKGLIHWTKCERGGWNSAQQRVDRPGVSNVYISLRDCTDGGNTISEFPGVGTAEHLNRLQGYLGQYLSEIKDDMTKADRAHIEAWLAEIAVEQD